MIFIPEQILAKLPRTFSLGTNVDVIVAHLHFRLHRSHWYVTEFDGHHTFYGLIIDPRGEATWDYFSLAELERKKQILSVLKSGPPLRTNTFAAAVVWDDDFQPTNVDQLLTVHNIHRK